MIPLGWEQEEVVLCPLWLLLISCRHPRAKGAFCSRATGQTICIHSGDWGGAGEGAGGLVPSDPRNYEFRIAVVKSKVLGLNTPRFEFPHSSTY